MKTEKDRLHPVPSAAAELGCSPRTIENPNSTIRKALEARGAVVKIGRLTRIKDSGVRALVEHGAPDIRANPVKRKERTRNDDAPPSSARPRRRKAGEQPEAA